MQAELARPNQNQVIDQELRIRTDTETWLAETLHGSMQTNFEFGYDGEFIRGEDGGSLDEIFNDSIAVAREITEHSPNMMFELRRRIIERGELDDMYGMINGELPNTMIVISDFPEELKGEKQDVGGYNVNRQQTMLRIITAKDDKIQIITRSLDGSNRKALESIYDAMGEPFEEGELLSQRIHRNLDETWQEKLPTILTEAHDASLEEQTGEKHYAGIKQSPSANIVDTYKFVQAQSDLVDLYTQLQLRDPLEAKKQRYNVGATMRARHQKYLAKLNEQDHQPAVVDYIEVVDIGAIDTAADSGSLQREMQREGRRALAKGVVLSGCGETDTGEDSDMLSTENQLEESGFGRLSRSNTRGGKCKFKSKSCPECKKKDVMTTVTETHIEGDCGCKVKRKPAPPPASL